MFRKPEFITFTGADDDTSISEMHALARDYPVEFGILFSPKRTGTSRYPSAAWVNDIRNMGFNLAAHICGGHSRDLLATGQVAVDLTGFRRVQVNTGEKVDVAAIAAWAAANGVQAILQCRGEFPDDPRLAWLYDRSGGTGVMPDTWPVPHAGSNLTIGYAGGLGPDTVLDVLPKLPSQTPFWIDMESRVRDDHDRFDLAKCRRVCELVFEG